MNNKEEIIKAMGMGMSNDPETIKLANSLLVELCPDYFDYSEYFGMSRSTLDSMWYYNDYYYFHYYIIRFRNKYFPGLIYSPYTKTFKGYVGS